MKIINAEANQALSEVAAKPGICLPLGGLVSGPIRIIGGVAQAAINLVAAIFLVVPSVCGLISESNPFHASNLIRDAGVGGLHIIRGVLELCPFTGCLFLMSADGRAKVTCSDNPFVLNTGDFD